MNNDKYNLIVKSNDIIEASYSLSLQEQRIIAYMISEIKNDDKDFNLIQLSIKDFKNLIGCNSSESYYSEIIKVTDNLRKKTLEFKNEKNTLRVGWLASMLYCGKEGYIQLEFSKMLKPYLLQLKERFTKYYLNQIINMRHSYSIRIFEILKQYEKIGKRYYDLKSLYWILKLEGKYKDYYNFKKRVIEPVKKELDDKYNNGIIDLTFNYIQHKTGRKVTGITFEIIKPNKSKMLESKSYNTEETTSEKEILNKLLRLKISKKQANNIIKNYNIDVIERNIELTKNRAANEMINNIPAFLIESIKNDYAKNSNSEILITESRELKAEAMKCWNKNRGTCRTIWNNYKNNKSKACHYCLRFKDERKI